MAISHQQHVADYHKAISQDTHHGGHDMYIIHRDWHQQNRDPVPPRNPDRNWGMNLIYGTNFLQMHHEMVKAASTETRHHMMHKSIVEWYQSQNINLPSLWNPSQPIPIELEYKPDISVFPNEIQAAVKRWAQRDGKTVDQFLTRNTNDPKFELPKYFTIQGVGPGESGEPITGARKLADFRNTNQLGCCLVYPHNNWHGAIGGAMGTSWTAIADPIFYFGVHWHIDRVFDDYKSLQAQRNIRFLDRSRLFELHAIETEQIDIPEKFTKEQQKWAEDQENISKMFHRL